MNFLSPRLLRPFFIYSAAFFLIPLAPQLAQAQSQSSPPTRKSPPPPPAPPPAVDQEQFISYWTTETGWRTELQLRNNAVGQDLTVTPALRLPDGAETSLAPVTIKSQEVASINLDAAIPSAAPQLIGAYGSVVLRYRSSTFSGLYAVAMIHGIGHSIAFHIDGMNDSQDQQVGGREGIWWFPNSSASDYLVLVNQGQDPLPLVVSLFDSSGKASAQNLTVPPVGTSRLSVRHLVTAAGLTGSYGGIKVSAANHAGSLNTLHVLFDENAGFSAILKMFDRDPSPKLAERDFAGTGIWTLRAPMLALSNPDPALAFPVGTTLRPQIFIRNTTGKPIDAALRFNWRTGATTGKALGPQLHLLPYETRLVDVAALQDGTILPKQANWTSVTLTSSALPDELMAVAASYDATLKYGAQTSFSDQLSHQWKGSMWEYDANHDSIITTGNGGTKPTQAAFTIFYNQGTQKYELEQTLQPDEQMWIDVGNLIRQSVPDKNGKTLPTTLTSGSYEIRDLTNTGIGTLFEGKVIYDKTYGHVTYGCGSCCGFSSTVPWYDPVILTFLGPPTQDGIYGYNVCQQQYEDVSTTFYGNWKSSATSIITVDQYGTHTPQDVGSTTTDTFGYLEGTAHPPICPAKYFGPGGGGNVIPTISGPNTVWFFANLTVSGYATSIQLTSSGGSSTTWNITAGASKITVSSFTGSSINVLSSGTAFSSSAGDVKITATAYGQTSNPFSITTRTPNLSIQGTITLNCDQTYGYLMELDYAIQDQMSAALPSGAPVNENWTTGIVPDYSGTDWRRSDPTGINEAESTFADSIGGEDAAHTPRATCDGNSTPIQHWGQEWRVGSTTPGFGRRIQTDTLQKYLGHAAHTQIISPAP